MAGRTSARSSASRDQASSPPKSTRRQAPTESQSPVMRSTRSTRSQSRDPHDDDTTTRRATRSRGARQGSVESTASIDTAASTDPIGKGKVKGKGKGKSKDERTGVVVANELSTVAEGEESKDSDAEEEVIGFEGEQRLQSPGGLSNMSGTTALTSHSQHEIGELNVEVIEENLENLSTASSQLLQLLTPKEISEDAVERIVKELQIPGSPLGLRLNIKEQAYESYRTGYGTDLFIDSSYILRKLFQVGEPPAGASGLLPIVHEANVAKLVKTWLIAQPESRDTSVLLQVLDENFPGPFLTNYDDQLEDGGSGLILPSLDLALEIRTQHLISVLKSYKDAPGYQPDALLAAVFFHPPVQPDSSLSAYEDALKNGQCRPIAGVIASISNEVETKILQRISDIRTAFLDDEQAIHDGETVNFEGLDEAYSWMGFLTELVDWSQSRVKEIQRQMKSQGGILYVVESIKNAVHNPGEIATTRPTRVQKQLQPPAEIISASSSNRATKSAAALLDPFTTSTLPPSNQQQHSGLVRSNRPAYSSLLRGPVTPRDKVTVPRERATAPAQITERMRKAHIDRDTGDDPVDNENTNEAPQRTQERTVGELTAEFFDLENDKNKENRPVVQRGVVNPPSRRFIDPQINAQKVVWSEGGETQQEQPPRNHQKRNHNTFDEDQHDSEDDDSDNGFQSDQRTFDPPRRQQPSTTVEMAESSEPLSKKARTQIREEMPAEATRAYDAKAALDAQLQASAMATAPTEETVEHDGDDGDIPTYQEINESARANRPATKMPRKRKPWSAEEENALIRYISLYGSQWSHIQQQGYREFPTRDQVALKDKARNIKVDYLKAGAVLPYKFDQVALGLKERQKVIAAGYNPWRLEGEEVGEESIDIDGPSE